MTASRLAITNVRLILLNVARIALQTCALDNPGERRLVLDIGGGSTEVIVGKGLDILAVESFSTGTVRQSDGFFIGGRIDDANFDAAIISARGCEARKASAIA